MKINGKYELSREVELKLRNTVLKGIGAVVVIFALIIVSAFISQSKTGDTIATILDMIYMLLLLATIQTYSRATAQIRMEHARQAHKLHQYEQVIAALKPFVGRQSRFDIKGEAHYLLAYAAKQRKEDELLAYCKTFLVRFRKGEWAKKATRL